MATSTQSKRRNGQEQATVDNIESQITKIRSDISTLAGTIADYGAQSLNDAKSQAGTMAHEAVQASETALAELRSQLDRLERDLRVKVREKPLQAIGIAAGIGFLLALLMRR